MPRSDRLRNGTKLPYNNGGWHDANRLQLIVRQRSMLRRQKASAKNVLAGVKHMPISVDPPNKFA